MTAKATITGKQPRSALGVTYEHPLAFWGGVVAVTAGALMQLPMYFEAKDMGHKTLEVGFSTSAG